MKEYMPRLIDNKLDLYLKIFGGVSIVGPKWIGKTRTSTEKAKSSFSFVRKKGKKDPLNLARLNSSIVFVGDKPHLIDEWQLMPEVWDMVRADIDERQEKGIYILTGSTVPPFLKKNSPIHHSGAGRIATLNMSTMSLFETKDSSGEVSISSLFENATVQGNLRDISLTEIIHYIVRGGWPENLDTPDSSIIPKAYLKRLFEVELDMLNVDVDKTKLRRLMRSLARNVSTVCSIKTLKRDTVGLNYPDGLDDDTVSRYLEILSDFYLIYEEEVFCPDFRTTQRFKTGVKRHFEDTSLACALIGANEKNLMNDLEYLGFLFESLVTHDLRIYMESLGGYVSHYQAYPNDEVDAVLTLDDGRFGFVEIKLGWEEVIDRAAANLLRISAKLEEKPSFLAVVSGMSSIPYRRADGVYVLPLTSLRP
jgi:uncharacterized protein